MTKRVQTNIILPFLIIILLFSSLSNAQVSVNDSLKALLADTKSLDREIFLLLGIATNYSEINLDSTEIYLKDAKNKLENSSNTYLLGEYYKAYGIYLRRSGKINEAITSFKNSIRLYKEADSISDIQFVYNMTGTCFYELDMYDSAIYYHHIVTELFDISSYSDDKLSMLGANYNNLANVYSEINEKEKALSYYLKALKIFQDLKRYQQAAVAMDNIGQINIDINNYEKAIKYFTEAIDLNQRIGNLHNLCMNYSNLGITYTKIHDYDSAVYYHTLAANLSEEAGFPIRMAQSYHNLGALYIEIKKYDLALKYLEKSFKISKDLDYVPGEITNLFKIGRTYTKLKQYKSAEEHLLEAMEMEKKHNDLTFISSIYEDLYQMYEMSGKYKKAVEYFKLYKEANDSLSQIRNVQQLNELQTKYETEQKESENLKLKNQNKINKLIIVRQRLVVIAASFIIVLSIIILIIFIVNRNNRKKQFILLQEKNKTIEEKSLQLKESNYTKDMLFSIIAHDLRSPFNSLLGFASLLNQEVEAGNYDNLPDYTKELLRSSEKAFDLVDNLLNWAKTQQEKIEMEFIDVPLKDIINEVVDIMLFKTESKQIKIISAIQPDTIVHTDSNILKVVLRNLISNAIKFSYKESLIEIGCIEKSSHYIIYVKDNGMGMESDFIEKLLKNNKGISTSGTENEGGSGLGFILIKDFVKRLGGKVYIESIPEKGSTFSFTIPKKP